jgi:hypothetical protein
MPILPLPWASCVVVAALQEASAPPALELLDHARLARELRAIAEAGGPIAEVHKLGESRGGRLIEAVRLAGAGAADDEARPAILLVANLDGARVFASAVALHHARALAEGYADAAEVKALLDTTTVFIVPRANPDAAEARFATPRLEQRASGPGVDDDRDGRQGEDPPVDVDGDGRIAWIRAEDPDGEWKEDPTDPRAMVKAERAKGERGRWKLWPEGRDSDGDEQVAEDSPLDARVDRNFPAGWEAHAKEAGRFPTDEPEARALCDFVLGHPELALVVVYDALDSLVGEVKSVGDEAPAVKLVPPEGVLESDAKLLSELGKRYRKATGSAVKSEAGDKGTFSRWCYEHRGLLALSAALWDVPLEDKKKEQEQEQKGKEEPEPERKGGDEGGGEGGKRDDKRADKDDEPKPSEDAKRLKWVDAAGTDEAWRFLPWSAFEHPELGPVEVGGLAPFARLEPPAAEGATIAAKHLDWFLTLGLLLSRVRIRECTRERLGDGVHRVEAVIQNDSYLPLLSRSARRTGTTRPAKVRLVLPQAGKLLGGNAQELLHDLPGSGGRKEYAWLVQGPDAMEIAVTVETTHAGTDRRNAEVRQR